MIFSGNTEPTLKEVSDMLYWYSFTSRDALTNFEAENYHIAIKIGNTIRKACFREHRLHTKKKTLHKYYDSELFLAYARAIDEIRKSAPLFLTKANLQEFAQKTQASATFFKDLLDSHYHQQLIIREPLDPADATVF